MGKEPNTETGPATEPGFSSRIRRELFDRQLQRAQVVAAYKHEITDWCHHDLAVELVSARFEISRQAVTHCIAGLDWT